MSEHHVLSAVLWPPQWPIVGYRTSPWTILRVLSLATGRRLDDEPRKDLSECRVATDARSTVREVLDQHGDLWIANLRDRHESLVA